MGKLYIKINGITCNHCREKIKSALLKIGSIKKVSFDNNMAEIYCVNDLNKNLMVDAITELGYDTNLEMISEKKETLKTKNNLFELIKIIAIILLIAFVLYKILGFNIFNVIPAINSKTSYIMLFATGIITSFHCISMCGAINLVASSSKVKSIKKPLLYNLGRLTSYTLLGGIVGLLGKSLALNVYIQGMVIIVAGIFMLLISLNMSKLIRIKMPSKVLKIIDRFKTKGSYAIGLINGFMPCGPLQAMQIYAISTASFLGGALSMFVFALGTIPLMLLFGFISNILANKHKNLISKISTALILILSIAMINRGLLQTGIDTSDIFKPNYDKYMKSQIMDNYQYITIDLSYNGYEDIMVQKNIPVKFIINVAKDKLTGCNNIIKIQNFNIVKELKVGENIIEFTPTEEGTFKYTCWMNMLKNNIVVVDDIKLFEKNDKY